MSRTLIDDLGRYYAIWGPSEAISAVGPPWGPMGPPWGPHGGLWGVHGAATSRGRGWAMQLPGVDCKRIMSISKHLTALTTPRDTAVPPWGTRAPSWPNVNMWNRKNSRVHARY